MIVLAHRSATRSEIIIEEGSRARHLHRVDYGLARLTHTLGDGRIVTAGHLVAGDYFSLECLSTDPSQFAVEVISATLQYSIVNSDDLAPDVMRDIARQIGRQARRMAVCHAMTRRGSLRSRVAACLLGLLGSALAVESDCPEIRGLTQELLASAVSSERGNVTRILAEFQAVGVLESAYRSLRILDLPALEEAAGASTTEGVNTIYGLFLGEGRRFMPRDLAEDSSIHPQTN